MPVTSGAITCLPSLSFKEIAKNEVQNIQQLVRHKDCQIRMDRVIVLEQESCSPLMCWVLFLARCRRLLVERLGLIGPSDNTCGLEQPLFTSQYGVISIL